MHSGLIKIGMIGICLYTSLVTAGESGIKSFGSGYRPIVGLLGGYANINAGKSFRFVGTDDNVFLYNASTGGNDDGFIGAFLGVERSLPWSNWFVQGGVEYSYYWPVNVGGVHTVGIEPDTSTIYAYQYRIQTQQVLAVAKFLTTTYDRFHPYGSVGIGVAFNEMNNYQVSTQETGSINLTPTFSGNNQTSFAYTLGLGVDTDINQNWRLGLGYRYSGFGKSALGRGHVMINNYAFPVDFTLNVNNPYANQFVAQISYVA